MMLVRFCEFIEQKKKGEEDKMQMTTRLDEHISEVQTLAHNQFDMVNQFLGATQENTRKELEIINMKSENDRLENELKAREGIH